MSRPAWSRARGVLRNARLLAQAAAQHCVDDPALLAIQAGRRLPFGPRMLLGRAIARTGPVLPGLGALGSVMAGRTAAAERTLELAPARPGERLRGEVAILLDRLDLLRTDAPAPTRARAAWSRGDLDGALAILREAGLEDSRYALRLRSERELLAPGMRVPPPDGSRRPEARTVPGPAGDELRVLHLLTNSLPHTQSGYSLRSHRILTALRDEGIASLALTRTGYPVMVGVPLARDEDVVDGIRYARTLPGSLPQTQTQRVQAEIARALELVEEFRPHVLHTTTNYLNALVARTVSEMTGLPWVFEVRGLMEQTWVASHRGDEARAEAAASQRYRMIAAAEAELARAADAVVTLSGTMAEQLVERGVDPAAITLVPNAVDASLLSGGIGPARARALVGLDQLPGFGADAVLVGAVSALVDYEGFDVLLRAVAVLVADHRLPEELRERVHVVLAGEGVSRPGLIELAAHLGIADRVHLPGRVPRDEARRWVEALDVVVVPRRDVAVARAVTPQKPVEALALGRDLIVSDLPALREVVTGPDGRLAARLVPPEDPQALAEALSAALAGARDHAPDAATRRVAGVEIAAGRSWSGAVRRYREVYETVLAPKKEV
ncbi:glycosyl transferase [Brachybacterium phenoliresistens]|uniref:Glycosyl transferase n=1 Tax=Brachybacterium phenoliresistens TaxID=396014 RepID=Z9JUD8_9MICO|nr:glycosyl transferase [Brachybacterium phenoliresistens]